MVPVRVECLDEARAIWVDGTPSQDPIELLFWIGKWIREGQVVRVTVGVPD